MRRRCSLAWIAVLVAGMWSQGCVMYAGDRTPDLVGRGTPVNLNDTPQIEIVLRHTHSMDGKDLGGQFGEATFKAFQKSYEKVRPEFPFLAASGVGVPEPQFVLDLDTEVAEQGKALAMLSGFTLMIIPAPIHSDLIVRASLKTVDGEVVGQYEARGRLRGAIQILLLPLLPVLPFIIPGDEIYDDTMRDAFIQVGQGLEAHAKHVPR